ncbi:MAG: hypothetical protein JXB32_02325 [Deltaproteobacteria bacterium]|nr:hypothetical protein [Deltaproteobacteria bacterium]
MSGRGPVARLAGASLATLALLATATAARAQTGADAGPPAPSSADDAGPGASAAAPEPPAHAPDTPAPDLAARPATALGGRSVAAVVDPATVTLGGTVRYTITIRHDPDDRVQLPPRGTNPFGPCRSLGMPREGKRDEGTVAATTYVFELVALEVTRDGLPPFPVSLISADGKAFELAVPPVALEVVDPTANEPLADVTLRGAKGADGKVDPVRPYMVHVRDWTLAWVLGIVGGALLVALLAVLGTRWWMRRRHPAQLAGPPPVPPYPAARERLERLRLEGAYARMGAKPFHVEMAEAVREYLGRRHDIDALEMTSEELIEALAPRPMGGITGLELEQFLASCDFVKFAKAEPREREALDELGTADRIVDQVERAMVELDLRKAAEAAARAAAEAAARAAAEAAEAARAGANVPGTPTGSPPATPPVTTPPVATPPVVSPPVAPTVTPPVATPATPPVVSPPAPFGTLPPTEPTPKPPTDVPPEVPR